MIPAVALVIVTETSSGVWAVVMVIFKMGLFQTLTHCTIYRRTQTGAESFSEYPQHLVHVWLIFIPFCKINGIFWLGGRGPERFRDLLNFLSQTHMALLPVPFLAPSSIDFTTFVLSCLTPRLFKYFPKIMSHVWMCSFSRMNHCERGHEPMKGD